MRQSTATTQTATPESPGAAATFNAANLQAIFNLAVQLHRSGNVHEAEPIYRRILSTDPDHVDTLHLLGVLYHQIGRQEDALRHLDRAVTLGGEEARFFRALGETYRALQRFTDAVASFEHALELEPSDADSLFNLGHTYMQDGQFRHAEICYRRALTLDAHDAEAANALAVTLCRQGKTAEAIDAYRRALELEPNNDEAQHMLAALEGRMVDRAPGGYVASLFDRYAGVFDKHLVERLHYDVPRLLRLAVDHAVDTTGARWRIADLGCGTGLCAERFSDLASELVGVDLSAGMIAEARKKSLYHELHVGEMADILTEPDRYDVVLAGDVFIYVGGLEEVFAAIARSLRSGGLLAFSTEACDGERFAIRASGRFAHSPAYVRSLAARTGFEVLAGHDILLRMEQGRPIPGEVFVLRRL